MFVKIKDGEEFPNAQQCVFAAFYAEDGKPYKNYKEVGDSEKETVIPLVLMQLRWDGQFGFPGGKVDKGESFGEALVREVKEELNYDLNKNLLDENVMKVGSYTDEHRLMCQHCFGIKVTYKEIDRIRAGSLYSEHIDAEHMGSVLAPMITYEGGNGFQAFRSNRFKATAGLELDDLVKMKGWKV